MYIFFGGGTGVTPEDDEALQVGLDVFPAESLAGGSSACSDESWSAHSRQPAATAQALGRQLEQFPRSTVTRSVRPTSAFGHDAFHLRLRVDNGCPAGQAYRVAAAETDFGISYSDTPQEVVVDFLVVDVDGTPCRRPLERGRRTDRPGAAGHRGSTTRSPSPLASRVVTTRRCDT